MYFIEEFRLAFCLKILEVLRVAYLWAPTMATHRAHDPMESKWTPPPTHTSVTPFALASAHFTLRLQTVTISSPFTLNSSVSSPPPHPLIHWGDVDPGRNRWESSHLHIGTTRQSRQSNWAYRVYLHPLSTQPLETSVMMRGTPLPSINRVSISNQIQC